MTPWTSSRAAYEVFDTLDVEYEVFDTLDVDEDTLDVDEDTLDVDDTPCTSSIREM